MRTYKLKNCVRSVRLACNLTQSQLADLVGTTKNTISAIETGAFCCSAHLAARLCAALDVEFSELFWFDLIDLYSMGLAKEGRDFLTPGIEDFDAAADEISYEDFLRFDPTLGHLEELL